MQIYTVGGAVRDKLLGENPHDRDFLVTGATVEQMLSLGYEQVGKAFPVFLHPKTHEEYALARTEKKAGVGYTGFVCDFNPEITLEEDLRRRDLTINAIAEDEEGRLYDPYHGIDDLKERVLRHVSPAFAEDPLRVLRVARFAAKFFHLGFRIAPETMELMRCISASGELKYLSPERIFEELNKALCEGNPDIFIIVLRRCEALKQVFPELDALYGVPSPPQWHPEIDSGVHTVMTLRRISLESQDPIVRFAMLCHDLGKACTPTSEWPHHHNHSELGIKPLQEMCSRLRVPKAYSDFAALVVRYHSDMHNVYRGGALGLIRLFEKLDAFRRPERVKPYLLCCKCDFLGRRGFENRPFPRSDYIYALFCLLNTVRAAEFVQAGFKGPAIQEEMRKKRLILCEDFLKTLPKIELDDFANSLPAAAEFRD
ncbi:MAG: multifunctional CCA addition/repair protein [Succinivibrio sp.]|nr:multifunctional CCA addition/repair protein [Succinivibrio sp.]